MSADAAGGSTLVITSYAAMFKKIYHIPYLLLILAVFFWSGNFIVGRAVRADVPPIALAFWRWTIAALLVLSVGIPDLKRDWKTLKKSLPVLILLSAVGVASFNTLVYTGLQWSMALNAFLMQSLMPVLIVAMSFVLFREKITALQALGIVLSLSGALTIIVQGNFALLLSLSLSRGDALFLIAVICYAAYSVLLRMRPAVHPLSFVAVTFAIGAILLLPLYLWESLSVRAVTLNRPTLMAIGYVAVFPSIVSYLCYNRGVELVGANRAGLFMHLMPVFGSILAIVLLGESMRWFHGLGIGLIASGILATTRGRIR